MAKNKNANETPEIETPAVENTEQMVPATEPAAAAEPPKEKRPARAEHEFLNANGDIVEDIELATGIRYTDKATTETFNWQIPNATAGSIITMFAIFGAKTRAINAGSAARQQRARDNTFTMSDVAYMTDVFAGCTDGQWSPPADGAKRGPKYDLDILAAAIVDELTKAGKTPNPMKIREKLGDDVAFRRGAVQVPGVLENYNLRAGKTAPTIDSLNIE